MVTKRYLGSLRQKIATLEAERDLLQHRAKQCTCEQQQLDQGSDEGGVTSETPPANFHTILPALGNLDPRNEPTDENPITEPTVGNPLLQGRLTHVFDQHGQPRE